MDGETPTTPGRSRLPIALAVLALLAASGPGCTGPLGTTATHIMRSVKSSPDPNLRYQGYAKLGQARVYDDEAQKVEAVKMMSAALNSPTEPIVSRAVICRTLGELGRPEARPALRNALNDPEPAVRAAACRSLGKVGGPEDATELTRMMVADAAPTPDCRIAAIEALGDLKANDPRIVEVLVDGLENPDPAIRLACLESLRTVTREDKGVDPKAWREYARALAARQDAAKAETRR